jgi:hypothetical protein
MPYSWQTPITDRAEIDVINKTSKGYYNYTDPNRVDNNTRYLEEYVEANIGYTITLSAYTTSTVSTLPTVAQINGLEANINAVRDGLGYDPADWITLNEDWEAEVNDEFLYTNANNLEQNLLTLKENFEDIFDAFRYCGTFWSGYQQGLPTTEELL